MIDPAVFTLMMALVFVGIGLMGCGLTCLCVKVGEWWSKRHSEHTPFSWDFSPNYGRNPPPHPPLPSPRPTSPPPPAKKHPSLVVSGVQIDKLHDGDVQTAQTTFQLNDENRVEVFDANTPIVKYRCSPVDRKYLDSILPKIGDKHPTLGGHRVYMITGLHSVCAWVYYGTGGYTMQPDMEVKWVLR